jgi:hypothetical protein
MFILPVHRVSSLHNPEMAISLRQKRSFCERFYDGNVKFETEPNMNRDWPTVGCTGIGINVQFEKGTEPGTSGQHCPPLVTQGDFLGEGVTCPSLTLCLCLVT